MKQTEKYFYPIQEMNEVSEDIVNVIMDEIDMIPDNDKITLSSRILIMLIAALEESTDMTEKEILKKITDNVKACWKKNE